MSQLVAQHELPSGHILKALQGDLTEEAVDGIVNAANAQLAHGGGLAAAIVRRGGRQIQLESEAWVREHGPVSHDTPAVTGAGDLPCRFVIHAVGPRWGEGDEDRKLAAALTGVLRVADERGLASLAIPAISTGIFGFPVERGARVILEATEGYLNRHPDTSLQEIRFTNIDLQTAQTFAAEFARRWPESAQAE